MEERIETIKRLAQSLVEDATRQSAKGNKAAGVRARKTALTLMAEIKAFRRESVELSKNGRNSGGGDAE